MPEKEVGSQEIEELLSELSQCIEACAQTMMYCLKTGGELAKHELIIDLLDCSEICRLAEGFFLRESEYGADILDICADICSDAGENCERYPNDKILKSCGIICRNCADACEKIIYDEEIEEEIK